MRNMVQGLTSHERPMLPQGLHVAQHDFAAVSTIQGSPVPSDFAVARLDQLDQMPSSATAWYPVKNGFALETLGPVAPASRTLRLVNQIKEPPNTNLRDQQRRDHQHDLLEQEIRQSSPLGKTSAR